MFYSLDHLTLQLQLQTIINIPLILDDKGVFKEGVQGVQTHPLKFLDFFLKSEGKEVERKGKKLKRDGGGVLLTYFLGLRFFRVGLRNFRGVQKFSGGFGNFRGG